jgi:hypothetical protein
MSFVPFAEVGFAVDAALFAEALFFCGVFVERFAV